MKPGHDWLLLLYPLPARKNSSRVSDEALLQQGGACFDALYEFVRKQP